MKSRWIAMLVCLLFTSVCTVCPAIHHHPDDEAASQEPCPACAWHHEAKVDLPPAPFSFARPAEVVLAEEPAHSFFRELSLKIHPCRGPPGFLL
jgi:hypothetical protein